MHFSHPLAGRRSPFLHHLQCAKIDLLPRAFQARHTSGRAESAGSLWSSDLSLPCLAGMQWRAEFPVLRSLLQSLAREMRSGITSLPRLRSPNLCQRSVPRFATCVTKDFRKVRHRILCIRESAPPGNSLARKCATEHSDAKCATGLLVLHKVRHQSPLSLRHPHFRSLRCGSADPPPRRLGAHILRLTA